jgi:hypothetical protein
MADFAEVSRIWAARKLNVDRSRVRSCAFELADGYAYSEHTYEPAQVEALITLQDGQTRSHSTYEHGFAELLEELVETANNLHTFGR